MLPGKFRLMRSMSTAAHWNEAYARGEHTRSWYQSRADMSLQLFDELGVEPQHSVVDVGGGASPLVDELLGRGHRTVCVLDVAESGVHIARQRLGGAADTVQWVIADVLDWRPARRFDVWHDRAAFHFLADPEDRERYRRVLAAATAPDAVAVLATFAPDGPRICSGLPVLRWDAGSLAAELAPEWELVSQAHVPHITPAGAVQPFTWTAFKRRG
jgi:trans-aconitate methyltransferase